MEVITLLKINELYNIKHNIIQIGGLINDPKLKEIELMHNEISNKLNDLISNYAKDKEELIKLSQIFEGGGNEKKINISKEYDFINENITKLENFNKKYLSSNMKELQYQLNYSENIFTDDLESLDDPDDSNYALAENLNYNKNAKKNNIQTIFTQSFGKSQIPSQPIDNLPIAQQSIPNVSNSNNDAIVNTIYNKYKSLYNVVNSINLN
jgi:hypothetical protein